MGRVEGGKVPVPVPGAEVGMGGAVVSPMLERVFSSGVPGLGTKIVLRTSRRPRRVLVRRDGAAGACCGGVSNV